MINAQDAVFMPVFLSTTKVKYRIKYLLLNTKTYCNLKRYLLIYLLFLIVINASAQDFEFGKISQNELDMKVYSKDSAASAVVLKEFGTAQISSREKTPLVFEYHVRIKIFNSKGFEHGDVILRLHKQNQREETFEDIEAVTFSKDENGNAQS